MARPRAREGYQAMTIRCPDCGRVHDVDDKQGGDKFTCDCGRLMTVPSTMGAERIRSVAEARPSAPPPPSIRTATPFAPPPIPEQPAEDSSPEPGSVEAESFGPDPLIGFPEPESVELRPYGAEPPPEPEQDQPEAELPAQPVLVGEPEAPSTGVQWGASASGFPEASGQYMAPGTTWEFRGVPLLGQGPVTGKPIRGVHQRRTPQTAAQMEVARPEARDLGGQRQ